MFCLRLPLQGTDDEKAKFRSKILGHKFLMQETAKETTTARVIIYVLADFVLLQGLYLGFAQDDFAGMIVDLFICLLYLILAFWCQRNPFGAILTAFIIYLTLQVINAFFEPSSLFQGIFIKIFFIVAFVKGIRSAKEAQEHLAELEKVKASPIGDH